MRGKIDCWWGVKRGFRKGGVFWRLLAFQWGGGLAVFFFLCFQDDVIKRIYGVTSAQVYCISSQFIFR